MKEIPLTKGKFAIVDDEDYEILKGYAWLYSCGYAVRNALRIDQVKLSTISMHRVIAKTPGPLLTDHKNGNKLDNRKENLRICTFSENFFNQGPHKDNLTGYKGVCFNRKYNRYQSQIMARGKSHYLGSFLTAEEAHAAYVKASKLLHGEFSKTA